MPKRNTIINSIKNCIFSIGVILCSVIIISNPVMISKGVSQGIYNCRNIIIPSLFPFMILCIFVNISPLVDIFCNFLKPVIKFVFGLPSNTSCLILMSFIGGYPMGARMVSEMLDKNQISKRVGERLIYFCVNAGPAFVVTAIGHVMWNDRTIGLIFLISHIMGSILIGFLLNVFSRDRSFNREEKTLDVRLDYSSAFVKSVSDAVQVIIGICAFVVTFSVIITVFKDYKIIYFISSVISKIFFLGTISII